MAIDLNSFRKQTSKNYADSEAAAIQAAKDAANANIKLIEDNYGTQIADAKAAYDPLFRQNEIQRAVNERYLERRAAEMGLTDSGLSRTQQTANRLSYSNQNAEYMRQRQKAVDTLKAAMDAKILEQNTNLNTNIAGIKTTYADKRTADAVSMYNEAVKNETELEKEKLKYINNTATTAAENFKDLYNTLKSEYKANNSDGLGAALDETKISPVHAAMIYEYQKQSGLPTNSTQMKMLLNAAGISAEDYEAEANNLYYLENGDKVKEIVPTMTSKAKQVLNTINGTTNTKVIKGKNIAPITNTLSLIGQRAMRVTNKTAWLKKTVNVIENSGLSETEKLAVMLELGIVDDVAALKEE